MQDRGAPFRIYLLGLRDDLAYLDALNLDRSSGRRLGLCFEGVGLVLGIKDGDRGALACRQSDPVARNKPWTRGHSRHKLAQRRLSGGWVGEAHVEYDCVHAAAFLWVGPARATLSDCPLLPGPALRKDSISYERLRNPRCATND